MRTSFELYQRIRWDARFDPARFVVLVDVHAEALARVPLPSFVPGGDIPWHRVIAFEADGEIVWDRRTGIDCIERSEAGRRGPEAPSLRPPSWAARPRPSPPMFPRPAPAAIRVLTWNTLWDRFEPERLATARRRPLLLRALRRADADVVALQEVEAPLQRMVLEAPWVAEAYTASLAADDDVADFGGILLLSRLPVREVAVHTFGPHKSVVAMVLETADRSPLLVAAVHLTSDRSSDGAARRAAELEALVVVLASAEANGASRIVLAGDFNEDGDDLASRLALRDAWLEHGPPVPTFDPTTNPLAAIGSREGRPRRLDRVLVRGASVTTIDAALEGTEPVEGLWPSDHSGVRVDLALGTAPPTLARGRGDLGPMTHRTALAWIPPESAWPPIQAIRRAQDPSFERWPPHVNLLYGFVAEAQFDHAAARLSAKLAQVPAFPTVLEGVRSFPQNGTVWLDPTTTAEAAWSNLRGALVSAFPEASRDGHRSTPHLTLGRSDNPEALIEGFARALGRTETAVGELALLSRRGPEPMAVRAVVALGTGAVRWIDDVRLDAPAPDLAREAERTAIDASEVGALVERIQRALPDLRVELSGSRRIGCASPGADVDLVVSKGPVAEEPDVDGVAAALRAGFPELRLLDHARVPSLELRSGGLDVDVSVGTDAARSAVTDADALLTATRHRLEPFRTLARTVKRWARARGLDAAAFGGVPSIAWLVLAARAVLEADARELARGALLRRFFATWTAYDWRQSVALAAPAEPAPGAAMTILTPTSPVRSTTTQVGPAMLDLVLEELYRGWQLGESDAWGELDAAPPLHRRHRSWAVVEARGSDPASAGRVRGRMVALLRLLERRVPRGLHAWPDPFGGRFFAIGLGPADIDAAELATLTAPWTTAPVTWKSGGEVPTLGRRGAIVTAR